jgi:hypothetical protein
MTDNGRSETIAVGGIALEAAYAGFIRGVTHRRRRRQGTWHVRVPLLPTEVDALVQMGFLKQEDRHDPQWLQTAVMGLIYWVLDDPELMARRRGTRSR